MKVVDLSFPDPEHNLLYDDELLRSADRGEGGEVLRLWESPSIFVVLGRTCQSSDDVLLDACQQDHIPVLKRSSGGGTVLQGPGCLNFSLILSKEKRPVIDSISKSYVVVLDKVQCALKSLGVPTEFRPVCDLVLSSNGKKFSGNAQRRGRCFILHHGTLLYGFDLSLISKYLKNPKKMPEYRQAREHNAFVTNLQIGEAELKQALTQEFTKY
jgi:lipoate---protein ligase